MSKQSSQIAEAAAALAAQPNDLDAWWALSIAFAENGPKKRAAESFAELGEAASRRGLVGLAVACAIKTKVFDPTRSVQLTRSIAQRHARSERTRGRHTAPPMPPPEAAEEPGEIPAKKRAALVLAAKAISKAKELAVERTAESLPPQHLAAALSPEDLVGLVAAASLVEYKTDEPVIEQGRTADTLYWVARGSARAERSGTVLGELRSNMFFGEIALLSGTTRTAGVVASEPTWLLEVPAESLERLASSSPDLATVLARHARRRLLSNLMTTSPLFTQLTEAERASLLREFESRILEVGESLIENGSDNDKLFVIVSGAFEVKRTDEHIATLICGDAVGEKSLLSRAPAEAEVVATEPGVVLFLERAKFDAVAVEHPGLLAEVYKLIVEREKQEVVHDASDLVI